MITRLLVLSIFGFLASAASANTDIAEGLTSADSVDLIVADNRRRERRDGRQDNRDDKQDCRQEEGLVGDDKRECKQDDRGEGDDAEAEGDDEPEGAEADA